MFNFQRLEVKTLVVHLNRGFPKASPTPTCHPLSPMSLRHRTMTSDQCSFTVSYLINSCGFSPETALKASKRVRLEKAQKPDSVLAFFRNHGFSNPQMYSIIGKAPWLLACNPHERLLPKFEFLLSKGASSSDVVRMVSVSPRFLSNSLENHIIPTYELVKGFLQSDEKAIAFIKRNSHFFSSYTVAHNVKLLLDNGVTNSNIALLLRRWPILFCMSHLNKSVQELKRSGFDPSKSTFSVALLAKAMSKSKWDAKVDALKSWGCSEEEILKAFRRQPNFMLISKDKINAVMSFWVNQLGWSSLDLVQGPIIFGCHLEKRIIPRASVIHYLLSRGLRNKSASLTTPFVISEKVFLQKFVTCFKEEETSQILKLYQEKMNLSYIRGNGGI